MVSFAHVRTQAHDIVVYSKAGISRRECLKNKMAGHQNHGIDP